MISLVTFIASETTATVYPTRGSGDQEFRISSVTRPTAVKDALGWFHTIEPVVQQASKASIFQDVRSPLDHVLPNL